MTDIVERLRANRPLIHGEDLDAASAEILALRARLTEAEALLKHLREEWLETDDYAPEYRDRFNALLDSIDAFLSRET